jgi:AcrR family transcriptional regulator
VTVVPRRKQPEATRAALVDAARVLFAEKGYHDTSTEEIVAASGVGTRGSLYHHFADKKALFRAVHEAVGQDLLDTVRIRQTGDPMSRLRAGLDVYLDACLDPEVQRVLLLDGPVVLGKPTVSELEDHYTARDVQGFLSDAVTAGTVSPQSLTVLSLMLLAAIDSAALFIASSDQPTTARLEAAGAIDVLLRGLTQ